MLRSVLICICIFIVHITSAQVSFTAKSDRLKVGKNEKFKIDFILESTESVNPDIKFPNFDGFKVIAGPSTSTQNSYSYVNGKTESSFRKTMSFWLKAQKIGKHKIASAKFKIQGKDYSTDLIDIEVVEGVADSQDGRNPRDTQSKNIHFKVVLSKSNPYVNEEIIATYKLFFKVDIQSPRIEQLPKFDGFWTQNIDINKGGKYDINTEYLNGELYNYIVLKKVVLSPQRSGPLKISPMDIEVSTTVSSGDSYDIFGSIMRQQIQVPLSTKSKTINVRALPQKGKPIDFKGAVGDFSMDVNLKKSSLEENTSTGVVIKISGKGNFKLTPLPVLDIPNQIEKYDPKTSSQLTVGENGSSGSITSEILLIPRNKGVYKINPVVFSFFDPKKEKYITLKSKELKIDVVEGDHIADQNKNYDSTSIKEDVAYLNQEIRYIKQKAKFKKLQEDQFIGSPLYYLLLVFPFVAVFFVVLFTRSRRNRNLKEINNKRTINKAKKLLLDSKTMMSDENSSNFYITLERTISEYLLSKLDISRSDFNKKLLREVLEKKGIQTTTIDKVISILNSCEYARYTPSGIDTISDDYKKSQEIIVELEKKI
ncbi:BatD family protein [Ichthyobacterium seriolicida]|uniref:Aerotolerance-related protein BatD n=1 Tax=Ichthyobacterium seriolicida TaxID=242600 RepID=A0A1J1E6H3_9FLAO|nr:BatD family protein [Ichthyobacterium seriolicida]BAV94926.1 aerotolerance-related protein BatD [Ichthyobacterium seriolicida]